MKQAKGRMVSLRLHSDAGRTRANLPQTLRLPGCQANGMRRESPEPFPSPAVFCRDIALQAARPQERLDQETAGCDEQREPW